MAREGRGLVCVSLTEERCDELDLHPMVEQNTSNYGTAFTVSVEARGKTTTGISAADRAATVLTLVDPKTKPFDLLTGRATCSRFGRRSGGVLKRAGQTEASVDLARIAGLAPAAVICEIMNEDGTMARVPDLLEFSEKHGIPIVSVADIIRYRMRTERLVHRVAAPVPPDPYGEFRIVAFRSDVTNEEHVALVMGTWREDEPVLVRVHSACLTGDVFGSGALRLRRAAAARHGADREGGTGSPPVPPPGGARDRPRQQAAARTSSRSRVSTPSPRTRSSASRPTCATTGSAPRSCETSA